MRKCDWKKSNFKNRFEVYTIATIFFFHFLQEIMGLEVKVSCIVLYSFYCLTLMQVKIQYFSFKYRQRNIILIIWRIYFYIFVKSSIFRFLFIWGNNHKSILILSVESLNKFFKISNKIKFISPCCFNVPMFGTTWRKHSPITTLYHIKPPPDF